MGTICSDDEPEPNNYAIRPHPKQTRNPKPSPNGYIKLPGQYTFSFFYIADERDLHFYKHLVAIPGLPGLFAKEDFLFGVAGVGMQGDGMIIRDGEKIFLGYEGGHWEYKGQHVKINKKGQWYYVSDPNKFIGRDNVSDITLVDAKFFRSNPSNVPFYTLAAPRDLPLGTQIYVPELATTYEVQTRGGGFPSGATRVDLFTGVGYDSGANWYSQHGGGARKYNFYIPALATPY